MLKRNLWDTLKFTHQAIENSFKLKRPSASLKIAHKEITSLLQYGRLCPCGGIILADTEEWTTPLCDDCYSDAERHFKNERKEMTTCPKCGAQNSYGTGGCSQCFYNPLHDKTKKSG